MRFIRRRLKRNSRGKERSNRISESFIQWGVEDRKKTQIFKKHTMLRRLRRLSIVTFSARPEDDDITKIIVKDQWGEE
jgi:hypothetical protein